MVKKRINKFIKHFWSEEQGLTSLLLLLCLSNFFIFPFFDKNQIIHIVMRIFWFLLIVTGIITLSRTRSQFLAFFMIPSLLILVTVLRFFIEGGVLTYIEFLVDISCFVLLISMVLIKVFESGPVTTHRIVGAIVVYMLIGNLWALIFLFLNGIVPGSFQVPFSEFRTETSPSDFLYFSFTTLTTTGFGEILPLSNAARTMVIIEQLIGVLYPVILIGRLVSLNTDSVPEK